MPDPIKFYADAHIAAAVTKSLRKNGVDIVRAYEVGLADADDPAHLAYARRENRVLVTKDTDFLAYHAQGRPHAGIAFFPGAAGIGYMIARLLLVHATMTAEECRGRVEHL